jgi:hypothetical protein
MEQFIAA